MANNAAKRCRTLRARLQRRIERGPPALGAKAWRNRNQRMLADAKALCEQARMEDQAVLDDVVGTLPPSGLAPAGLVAGGSPVPDAAGLTSGEIARYGAIGLAVAATAIGAAVFLTR